MHDDNPDTHPVSGQGDPLDRGADTAAPGGEARKAHAVVVDDDEFARPEEDRSPLT
jgi:hypothetical protein